MSEPVPAETLPLAPLPMEDRQRAEAILPAIYHELHDLAAAYLRQEPPGHTLQPTALVHEAFVKVVQQRDISWQGRTHLLALSARFMRRVLLDHARRRAAAKRGGGQHRIDLADHVTVSPRRDADVLAVDDALNKLALIDPRQAAIVEMRFFAGMTISEVAAALGLSRRTIESEWTMVKAWLRRELSEERSE